MSNVFIERFIKRPPPLFPLGVLFHFVLLAISIYTASTEPLNSVVWIDVAWMVLYTTCWLFVCDMKKWAAIAYSILTVADLVCYFLFREDAGKQVYISSMLFLDVLFSMFILAYYKRFS